MKEIEQGISVGSFDFNGYGLRSLVIDGVEFFVAIDACRILDLGNTTVALRNVEDDDKFTLCRSEALTIFEGIGVPPQVQSLVIVTESGLWKLVMRSTKAQARDFQQWITREVIPAIRQTGGYSLTPALTEDEIVHQALQITTRRIEQLTAQVQEMTPKAQFHDAVVASPSSWPMREAALELGWTRNKMMAEMRRLGILKGTLPYARYAHHFEVERVERPHAPGTFDKRARVKDSALPWLNRRLNGAGLQVVSE